MTWVTVCVCVFQTEGVPTVLSTCVCHCPLQRVSITPHWGQKPFCTSCYEVSSVYRDHCVCLSVLQSVGVSRLCLENIFWIVQTFVNLPTPWTPPPPPPPWWCIIMGWLHDIWAGRQSLDLYSDCLFDWLLNQWKKDLPVDRSFLLPACVNVTGQYRCKDCFLIGFMLKVYDIRGGSQTHLKQSLRWRGVTLACPGIVY